MTRKTWLVAGLARRSVRAKAACWLLVALFTTGRAAASELSDELKARRARVMEKLGPDAMLILWSAPPRVYSLDIDYEYRQDSNLYYLTGLTQDNTILVLMPGNTTRREILFVKDRNPSREQWTGALLTTAEAKARTGVDRVFTTSQFESVISALLQREPAGGDTEPIDAATFYDALSAGRARVAVAMPTRRVNDPLSAEQQFAQKIRDRYTGFQVMDASPILAALRMVKSPYERKVLTKSVEISSDAQMAGMRAAHSGAREYEVLAAIEAVQKTRGAESWSYPSIVGSGPNATILHYPRGEREMKAGELLLVDAACSYGYMAADITRTYPVSGTFSPLQKDIYQIVLQAQEASMSAAKPGGSLFEMHKKTIEVIKAGLLKLGLITDTTGEQWRMWYTHGSSHYLGVDVHDVGDNKAPLVPGMAFTIEPGIYIRPSVLDTLPRTAENNALIEKIQAAVTQYADIGVRIEDSFLLEESGLKRLSASVPRTIEEIEAFLKPKGSR
jgi:Xaa-Pro aminopeptidase